jgi:hypothetical protein
MEDTNSNGTFDPARRRLCPDGACLGLIREDGTCSECGRTEAAAAAGEEVAPGAEAPAALSPAEADGAPGVPAGGFDPGRRLCDDGGCVGVVSEEGVCSVCGRRSE